MASRPLTLAAIDLARAGDDRTVVATCHGFNLVEASNMTAAEFNAVHERLAREMNEQLTASAFATMAPEPAPNTLSMESFRRAMRMMRERGVPDDAAVRYQHQREAELRTQMYERAGFLTEFAGPGTATFDPGANERGIALLKQWLSPAQRDQYERNGWFEVTGSDSGNRYRIKQGASMNVEQIDGEGRPICGWCFVPQGPLVAGDVMLAQKVALETDERAALKVAKVFVPVGLDMRPGALNYVTESNPGSDLFGRLFQSIVS